MVEEYKRYHGKYLLTLVFASVFLFSVGMVSHNAFGDNVAATIPMGNTVPSGIGANPDTGKVYVAIALDSFSNPSCYSSANRVDIINGTTDNIIGNIQVGNDPSGVAVNPNTDMIYVTNWSSYTVSVINGKTDSVVATVPVASASGVGVNPITNMIYVTDSGHGKVDVINGTTNNVTNTISVGSSYLSYPGSVVVNPQTNKIYVIISADKTVAVIDGTTNTVIDTISGFNNPQGITVNPTTDKIYVSDGGSSKVYVIDGTSDSITGSVFVGNSPNGLAVNPTTDKIYVSNYADDTVSIINGDTNNVISTLPSYSKPTNVAVNSATDNVYVVNSGGQYCPPRTSSITVIDGHTTSPQPPTGLSATAISSSQINLSWTAPTNNGGSAITGYEIQRSTNGGNTWYTVVSNTDSTTTSYSDTRLQSNTTYTYQVSAINAVGTSSPSNTASATTPLLSVGGINVGPVNTTLP